MDAADTQRGTTSRRRDRIQFAGQTTEYAAAPPFTVGQLDSMRRVVQPARAAR
jgi:hypothetical protein